MTIWCICTEVKNEHLRKMQTLLGMWRLELVISLLKYPPTEKYPFWKLVTMGASDFRMRKLPGSLGDRNEYIMFIDPSVDMNDMEEMSLPELNGNLYEVGEITDFMDIPNNPCIEVETENGAVILPLHEDFILSLDPENQEIIMQIPAGLI